ncbi:MAG: pirin family protein [Actinomycetia bacterium]|nr:pirin family protein [Actinomycetes bacterium]
MNVSSIELRPPDQRFHTDLGWLDSCHSFSFGYHHNPRQVGHGLLIVSNDDRVAPGAGFGLHPHRDMEIVTWVLSGLLEHRGSEGNHGVIVPGLAQRMSAGRGIRHSEMNHNTTEPVHFVPMWVVPDEAGIEPGYQQFAASDLLAADGLVPVASGRGHEGEITIHRAGAVMWVARLTAGERVAMPDAPFRAAHLWPKRERPTSAEPEPAFGQIESSPASSREPSPEQFTTMSPSTGSSAATMPNVTVPPNPSNRATSHGK